MRQVLEEAEAQRPTAHQQAGHRQLFHEERHLRRAQHHRRAGEQQDAHDIRPDRVVDQGLEQQAHHAQQRHGREPRPERRQQHHRPGPLLAAGPLGSLGQQLLGAGTRHHLVEAVMHGRSPARDRAPGDARA